jgi:hypothetical protein
MEKETLKRGRVAGNRELSAFAFKVSYFEKEDHYIIIDGPKHCRQSQGLCQFHGYFYPKGTAKVIDNTDKDYDHKLKMLIDLFTDNFPIKSIIENDLIKAERILAPSYYLYPETTEKNQAENAMKSYGVKPINPLVNG